MRRLVLAFGLVAALSFFLGPFLWHVLTSLRPDGELTSLGMPSSLSSASYRRVLETGTFLRAVGNSALVAAATTAVCLAIGASAAFALAKLDLPGKRVLLLGALIASMFPPIATVSPLYVAMRAVGLRDSPLALVLPYVTFALPLTMWVLTSYFREIPDEIYRAARVDGCSATGAFVRVLLPLAAPGIATTGILVFITAWNEFLYALTFTSSPEQRTVPVAISLLTTEYVEPWGEIAAASIVATLPLVVVTVALQRRIVRGLTAGAVKG